MSDVLEIYDVSTEAIEVITQGPQGPPGSGGGGGGSGTVTSVALAGAGLSITGSPVTSSGTITANVVFGTTAGTACEGNDARISGIQSGSILTDDASIAAASAGFEVITGNGTGQINTSNGGSINTYDSGGSIDTRGTGFIEFGEVGTRTTLTGTATADRAVSLPDAAGTLALTSDITKSAVGLGNVTNNAQVTSVSGTAPIVSSGGTTPSISISAASTSAAGSMSAADKTKLDGIASGATANSSDATLLARANHTGTQGISTITQNTNRILGRTTASTGAVEEITVGGGASLSAGALTVHAQSHAITSTSDHTATANRVFYSNNSGQVTELALGAANTVLTSNGTTSAPSFAAVSAGATNLWIPASSWIPRTTTGCGVDSTELSTNKVNTDQLLFDTATEEYAQALVMMPSNYNYGTITARFYWTASSGSGGVAFGLRGRAYADDDALDQAQGTGQVTTDTFIVADDLHVTAATSAITLAGTPAANRPVQFEIYRQVSNASDTLGVDARLLGVEVIFN